MVAAEDRGALIHSFDEHPVGVIGPLQGEHFLATAALHNNGIDVAGADGAQGLLGVA